MTDHKPHKMTTLTAKPHVLEHPPFKNIAAIFGEKNYKIVEPLPRFGENVLNSAKYWSNRGSNPGPFTYKRL